MPALSPQEAEIKAVRQPELPDLEADKEPVLLGGDEEDKENEGRCYFCYTKGPCGCIFMTFFMLLEIHTDKVSSAGPLVSSSEAWFASSHALVLVLPSVIAAPILPPACDAFAMPGAEKSSTYYKSLCCKITDKQRSC
eukprot:jgi/Bigna1/79803/fgenesh1_pg.65_\